MRAIHRVSCSRPSARRLIVGVAVLAVGVLAGAVGEGPPAGATTGGGTPTSDVTMVQANLKSGMPVPQFQADVSTVLAQHPDFVTYNEVYYRQDSVLAPAGYAIYRSTQTKNSMETPVVWRTDRWTETDEGTFRISDYRKIPPHKHTELGYRFANWVTLQGTDGRVLSVVSVHIAPLTPGMPDLLDRSIQRLGTLVSELAPRGPVLVGGDFNVAYTSSRYPRDLLTAAGLVPTYDTLGYSFPTGDHYGNTIDYIFDRGTDVLLADNQYAVGLNSDHDAVVGGFSWQVDLPSQSRVVTNDPSGDLARERAAVTALVRGINSAKPGSVVALATLRLGLFRVVRALDLAVDRGVHVHVVVGDDTFTPAEQRLSRHLAAVRGSGSWLRRCVSTCRTTYADTGVPRGFLMVGAPSGAWVSRYDVNRRLADVMVQRTSRVRISTGQIALSDGATLFHGIR
jgi:endonuclease/exonuclease/phosphatase (EEP) superfamily protein YafD